MERGSDEAGHADSTKPSKAFSPADVSTEGPDLSLKEEDKDDVPIVLAERHASRHVSSAGPHEAQRARMSTNTQKQTSWGTRVFEEWRRARNTAAMREGSSSAALFALVPPFSAGMSEHELNFWLCRFVTEVRRKDGTAYPPSTLMQLVCCIQRYLREECKRARVDFFNKFNSAFAELRATLDARIKQLHDKGYGLAKRQAQPYSTRDEERLWELVFSRGDAKGLTYLMYFYNCKVFGLRSAAEHRGITVDQFAFGKDAVGQFVEFRARSEPSPSGRPSGAAPDSKRQYADGSNPRCFVKHLQQYLKLIPKKGPFYRRPNKGALCYSKQVTGVHTIERFAKEMCEAAGIAGFHSRQSGRVTRAAALFQEGVDGQLTEERASRKRTASRQDQGTPVDQIKMVPDLLQPPKPAMVTVTQTALPEDDESAAGRKMETGKKRKCDTGTNVSNAREVILNLDEICGKNSDGNVGKKITITKGNLTICIDL
ncbi:uncharacterized protein LOC102346282 [Latimeria chalumnae]|uniref:uncharacterized protein LOC102346282 n=1 Tax=Latimeria chalumnae TaxID=7897 RepID=UPI0003C14174|nr:PREDICTED: uncharacterized protein LOC102346282 [Latimeria chalumnae]|eukprot:XP_005994024.1 PREDICTED: uncharacterized protein LOC102346282 [Latimeria chalumnae]